MTIICIIVGAIFGIIFYLGETPRLSGLDPTLLSVNAFVGVVGALIGGAIGNKFAAGAAGAFWGLALAAIFAIFALYLRPRIWMKIQQ